MSDGLCVTKYTPTPFERMRCTTCSIFFDKRGAHRRTAGELRREKYERRLVGIANLRQLFEHSDSIQSRNVSRASAHESALPRQDIDHPAALAVGLQQIVDVEHRLAEELIAALLLNSSSPR